MDIQEVDTPVAARPDNPFDKLFPTKPGKSLSVTLPGTEKDKTQEGLDLRKVIKQAQEAANTLGLSAKIVRKVETQGTGKTAKEVTTLTINTRDKITRVRKTTPAA